MREIAGWAVGAGLAAGLAACGLGEGRVHVAWSGSDSGRMTGAATAVWCRDARIAALTGIGGDTGIGLVIHPAESLVAGAYPIVEPAHARRAAPAAAVAFRFLAPTAVVGYQSDSGSLTLERVTGGRLAGRFEARARIATAMAGTIRLRGRFQDVAVETTGTGCPR